MAEEITSRLDVRSSLVSKVVNHSSIQQSLVQRFSVSEITTYRWSFFEDVLGCRMAGINALGIWRPKLVEFGEERGIELVRDSGITVSSLGWAGGFTGLNGHSYIDSLDDAFSALHLAANLDAQSLLVVSGARAGHTMNHAREIFVEALQEMSGLAAEYNVSLAVQPMLPLFAHEWTFLTRLDDAIRMLDACDHPQVQLAFDVYHLWNTPHLFKRIEEIAERTAIVQISDSVLSPRSAYERKLPGAGVIPIAEIIQAFEEAGFQGHYEANIWSEDLWKTDYDTLLGNCRQSFRHLCEPSRAIV